MGCDIHSWIEFKKYETEFGTTAELIEAKIVDREGDWQWEISDEPGYGDRSYSLFTMLAGVRQREFEPMLPEEPDVIEDREGNPPRGAGQNHRGIPQDASDFYKARVWEMGEDGHSHSWATLQELKEYFARHARDARYKEAAEDFIDGCMMRMADLATNEGVMDTDVRLVFFFDN